MSANYTQRDFIINSTRFGFFKTDYKIPFRIFTRDGYRSVILVGFTEKNCVVEVSAKSSRARNEVPGKRYYVTPESVMRAIRLYHDDLRYGAAEDKDQKLAAYYSKVVSKDTERLVNAGYECSVLEIINPYGQTMHGHFDLGGGRHIPGKTAFLYG